MKLELKHLAPYLPYDLSFYYESLDGKKQHSWILTSEKLDFALLCQNKPILRPISDLLQKLDFFEIGDDNNYSIEFDNGNIKLIKNLKSIADNKCYFDIQFLPYVVVQQLIEWHFDVFGLIDKGLAVSIHDVEQVIA